MRDRRSEYLGIGVQIIYIRYVSLSNHFLSLTIVAAVVVVVVVAVNYVNDKSHNNTLPSLPCATSVFDKQTNPRVLVSNTVRCLQMNHK